MPVALFDEEDRIVVRDKDLPGVENGDLDTTYTLRSLDVDTHTRLLKDFTKDKGFDKASHQRIKEVDGAGLAEALLDFVLVEWSGVVRRGQPVPCTLEQKRRLDAVRKTAMLELAGLNQIQTSASEVSATSFPPTA